MTEPPALTYRDAGVDIDAGDALVERIKPAIARTRRPGVIGGIGGFGGLFELPAGFRNPVLVAGTDGVGTKLRLAIELNRHRGVGIDLVAMCANDVVVQGAEPILFLDYYATGKLELDAAQAVVEGIARGCEIAGAALLGGETAEMPGMYARGDYDLAGFCVGIAERSRLIDTARVAPGDVVLGLASSGPHSNGYSLIRHILATRDASLEQTLDGRPLGELLLEPTRIYVKSLLALMGELEVHAAAHITGGGLPGNLNRVLSPSLDAVLHTNSWQRPPIFEWLQHQGRIEDAELLRTFNCGVGMTVIVAADRAEHAIASLSRSGESACAIGHIEAGSGEVRLST